MEMIWHDAASMNSNVMALAGLDQQVDKALIVGGFEEQLAIVGRSVADM